MKTHDTEVPAKSLRRQFTAECKQKILRDAEQGVPLIWNTTTRRDDGPGGTVVDRNCTLLIANAAVR